MTDAFPRPEAYVFVVTYGRSGSTLLQHLLNTLPGYQIRGENNNVLAHLASARQALYASDTLNGLRGKGQPTGPGDPWFGAEKIFPEDFAAALADVFIRNVLRPDPGVRVSGFKEIRFHADPALFWPCMDFMRLHFPQARFVFNTRDHAAVARSGWWADKDPAGVQALLTEAEALFAYYREAHPDICLSLHYDAYVADPEALRPLFDFLGETWDQDLVDWVLRTRLDHLRPSEG